VSLRAFPNPSRSVVRLQVEVRDVEQRMTVYDLRGRRVRTLQVPAGWKRVLWDGTDDVGERVAAGRYVVVLASDPSVRRSIVFLP
jgi:flagellar hook assembly protein FlgD